MTSRSDMMARSRSILDELRITPADSLPPKSEEKMNWIQKLSSKVSVWLRIPFCTIMVMLLFPLFAILHALVGGWVVLFAPFILTFVIYIIYYSLQEFWGNL